jgi:pre-mRNA-splicing factor SYF1
MNATPHQNNNYVKLQEESDLPYEEEILRHPYQIKCWMRYIDHKFSAPKAVINLIYERALKQLPGRWSIILC